MFPGVGELNLTHELVVVIIIALVVALLVIGLGLVWAIIKVRHEPAPAMLTITLGLLTLVCILGYFVTRDNTLGTLAGAGLGALAGSLTNVLQGRNKDKEGGPDA
jgi:hypothetical protein